MSILWDCCIERDNIKNKKEETDKLVNVKFPADKRVSVTESENLLKNKELEMEVEKLWHMQNETTGPQDWSIGKHVKQVPGNPKFAKI